MTLVFNDSKDKGKPTLASLTVPPEAVRGLRYNNAQWHLYVSDPDPMAVLQFKLLAQAIEEAAREIQRNPADRDLKPLTPHDGSALFGWLLEQPFVLVEPLDTANLPAMFPSFPSAGPRPNLGMKSPSIQR